MANVIFEKITEALRTGVWFSHSIEEMATAFIANLPDEQKDKINILVIGDLDNLNTNTVTRHLSAYLQFFEQKSNIRLITGDQRGVESIVQRYAKNNEIECITYTTPTDDDWGDSDRRVVRERNKSMLAHAHVVLIVTRNGSKELDFMYQLARDEGRLVSKRVIRSIGS